YPPREGGGARGSDILTAYILAAAHESGFALPQQSRDRMLRGLSAFVEGKIMRDFWSPKKDLEVRKLAALEALSRYGNAQPRMLGSIQIAPNLWPTSAVLDWMALLQRMDGLADRSVRLAEADSIIRARLNYQGTRSGFSSEADDYWWWLMASGDANANRLILTVLDSPSWRADLPRLASGSIARQQRGHWSTTGANVWGSLAIEKFSRKFESAAVSGVTTAAVAQGSTQQTGWKAGAAETAAIRFAWPEQPAERLTLKHEGEGKPWVTLQSLAAVPLKAPVASGFQIRRTVVPLEQKQKGLLSRGDIVRIDLEVDAQGEMTNVVVSDPVPAGASVLGSGLGRDAVIGAGAQRPAGSAWLAYEERGFEAFRSYYEYVPKGKFSMSYRVRLNNAGVFNLPQTRVEAMYAPEMFGEIPNAALTVK
ncbi:MAG: alpha-2-macroglobulin N-terminal region family protein, partial [Herminiimonas sp.]|nr:alpha-2-macroglobulin N-terminal region family protein [Herminiimonas sp.]